MNRWTTKSSPRSALRQPCCFVVSCCTDIRQNIVPLSHYSSAKLRQTLESKCRTLRQKASCQQRKEEDEGSMTQMSIKQPLAISAKKPQPNIRQCGDEWWRIPVFVTGGGWAEWIQSCRHGGLMRSGQGVYVEGRTVPGETKIFELQLILVFLPVPDNMKFLFCLVFIWVKNHKTLYFLILAL